MSTATMNDTLLAGYTHRLEEIDAEARDLLTGLTPFQLRWVPPDGGWSMGLVFEHLITGGKLYNDLLTDVVKDARTRGLTNGGRSWKPSLMGKFLTKAMRSPRKFSTFKVFTPSDGVGDRLLERFLEVQARLSALIGESEGLDLTRVRMRSPASPLVRFNLGDCYAILIDHAIRHLRQARRLKDHARFPLAATE